MQNNLISVCIPTYNQTIYLKKTIDSVYQQKDVNFELIISDDSTTNEVYELVQQYESFFPRITYIKNNPSLGSPRNWNYALSLAKGEYIKILHHDEYFISQYALKITLDCISSDLNRIVFSASKSINKGIERNFLSDFHDVKAVNFEPERLILANIVGAPSAILFHASKKEMFDTKLVWLVDIDFYINILKNKSYLFYVDEILYTSVIDDHNLTNQCLSDTELLIKEYTYLFRKHILKLSYLKQIFYFYNIYKYLKLSIKDSRLLFFRMLKKIYYV
jgi:glycosyltransferase involved in cell wall biosynthesis